MALIPLLGRDFFPSVDAGLIRLHMRARAGQRVEETAREADGVDNLIRQVIPPDDLGTDPRQHRPVQQHDQHHLQQLRRDRRIRRGNSDRPEARAQAIHAVTTSTAARASWPQDFPGTQFFFQPADMISQILNFGVPAPIDIQLIGPNERANYLLAQQITNRIQHIPGAVDVHVQQLLSYPDDFSECRPHPGAVRGPEPAGRGQQRSAYAQFQLPGHRHRSG